MTKKPDITVNAIESDDEEFFDLSGIKIKKAGPEEKAALLQAFKDGKVVFAPEAEEDLKTWGLSVEDIIRDIEAAIKSELN